VKTGIIDISPRVSARTGVFPGDTKFARTVTCTLKDGASVNLSSIQTTVHVGAHADAPWHTADEGRSIADVDLEPYWGPAVVLHVPAKPRQRLTMKDVAPRLERWRRPRGDANDPKHLMRVHQASAATPWEAGTSAFRCLIATGTFPEPEAWNSDFAAFDPELVAGLSKEGCVLVGIDTPSVDLEDSKDLPAHAALRAAGIANLEGLVLAGVDEGWYALVALPLKLDGLDGSPVRAALRTLASK
jgi:arylformamidase